MLNWLRTRTSLSWLGVQPLRAGKRGSRFVDHRLYGLNFDARPLLSPQRKECSGVSKSTGGRILKSDQFVRAAVRPYERGLLQARDHGNVQGLEKELRNWVTGWNENPKSLICAKIAKETPALLGQLLILANGSGP